MSDGRLFRIRMRPGRSMVTATSQLPETPFARFGEEAVVTEHVAAFLIRERAADIVEVIELRGEGEPEAE